MFFGDFVLVAFFGWVVGCSFCLSLFVFLVLPFGSFLYTPYVHLGCPGAPFWH